MNTAEPLAMLPPGSLVHVDHELGAGVSRWGYVTGPGEAAYFEPSALVHVVKLDDGPLIWVSRHLLTDYSVAPDRARVAFSLKVGHA